jgi:hypothetical protein
MTREVERPEACGPAGAGEVPIGEVPGTYFPVLRPAHPLTPVSRRVEGRVCEEGGTYSGRTDLKSEGNEVAVESVEVAYETLVVAAP